MVSRLACSRHGLIRWRASSLDCAPSPHLLPFRPIRIPRPPPCGSLPRAVMHDQYTSPAHIRPSCLKRPGHCSLLHLQAYRKRRCGSSRAPLCCHPRRPMLHVKTESRLDDTKARYNTAAKTGQHEKFHTRVQTFLPNGDSYERGATNHRVSIPAHGIPL
jgi:hypothetical protein